jgi:hypothetical protein
MPASNASPGPISPSSTRPASSDGRSCVDPLSGFFPAEAYHQDFLIRNPTYPYIVYNDLPKIDNLKQLFPDEYRDEPVTVAATQ